VKYLCLVHLEEKLEISTHGLHPVRTAVTVKVRNGHVSLREGPASETDEPLAGFVLLEARDLNEAILVAGRMPEAGYGSVEVRPIPEWPETAIATINTKRREP